MAFYHNEKIHFLILFGLKQRNKKKELGMADKLMVPENVLFLIPRTCEHYFTGQKGVCRCDSIQSPREMIMGSPVSSVTRVLIRERRRVRGRRRGCEDRSRVREEKRSLLVLKTEKRVQEPRNSKTS